MRSAKFDALLSRYYTIIIFLIPALTIFTLFVVLPIGEAAYYSFFRWNGYGAPEKFVGLDRFQSRKKNIRRVNSKRTFSKRRKYKK